MGNMATVVYQSTQERPVNSVHLEKSYKDSVFSQLY